MWLGRNGFGKNGFGNIALGTNGRGKNVRGTNVRGTNGSWKFEILKPMAPGTNNRWKKCPTPVRGTQWTFIVMLFPSVVLTQAEFSNTFTP
jgi:hypothetical protein